MPINPQHEGSITYKDFSNETSSMGFFFGPITALTIAAFLTQFGALLTATNAITLGIPLQTIWTGDNTKFADSEVTDENAQRERKFLVRYQGATTFSKYRLEIPTADLEDRLIVGSDFVDLTNTEIAAWITAFEALCKTPEGEAVQVLSIQAVGRNN